MWSSGDLEVSYCHPPHETLQGFFSRYFMSANLTSLPSSEIYDLMKLIYEINDYHHHHPPTSALLQLTIDVATGLNKRKPPHPTICVTVDLTVAFDTVNHNVLLSKMERSTLPELHQRQVTGYYLQRRKVEGNDSPH